MRSDGLLKFREPYIPHGNSAAYIEEWLGGVPVVAQRVKNPISVCEDVGSIPDLAQQVKIWCCLELWCRLPMWLESGVAAAPI